jgi:nucleotide-binding universal stress UspA family protein
MPIKDILVHVEISPAGRVRTELAIGLARRFSARLTGLFVMPPPEPIVPPDTGAAAVLIATAAARLKELVREEEARFYQQLHRGAIDGTWHTELGTAELHAARAAVVHDLVILGQHDPDHPGVLAAPEDVVLSCGRPVVLVPFAGSFLTIGERVLVAWNGSREAARALHAALAVVTPATTLTALTINPSDEALTPSGDELVKHLARHDIAARAETITTTAISPSDALLSQAADLGCDLIVMGAYGHSRLREVILGGVTRDMLRRMTVPVLMMR